MEWYWHLYNNCALFGYVRHFYLYVLKIDWKLQVIALLIMILLTIMMWNKYKLKKVTRCRAFACVNLPVYIFVLFSSLIFSRTANIELGVNMQPFWTEIAILSGETKYIRTLVQNLLMLVPYGILLPIARKVSLTKTVITGCLISVAIEVLQLVTKTGLCELDDVTHNTLGVLMGYGVFLLLTKMRSKLKAQTQCE